MRLIKTIYLDPLWGNVQQSKEDGEVDCFRFNNQNGTIMYPFIKRYAGEVQGTRYYDIVTARGECGPIVIEGNSAALYSDFNEEFQKYCDEEHIIAEYIRFDPWNTNPMCFADIYNLSSHGYAYCHKLQEDFFATQYSSRRRNQIRKAIKSGVDIVVDANWDNIPKFMDLYDFTVSKHEVSEYYLLDENFLNGYRDLLGGKVKLGLAYYHGELVAGGIFLNGGDVFHYHFSASHPDYVKLNAISLLLFEEAKKGAEEGCAIMDLGGATPGSGLEKFKQSMVKQDGIIPCFVGTKVRNQEVYNALVDQCGGVQKGFFPAYRKGNNTTQLNTIGGQTVRKLII